MRRFASTARPMVLGLGLCVGLCTGLGTGGVARAKAGLQGALTLAGGYNDNPLASPTRQPDFFLEGRPSLILTIAEPRALQRLIYTFDGALYLRNSSIDTYANTLAYDALLEPSKRISLLLSAGFTEGQVNFLATQQSSDAGGVAAQPTGSDTFVLGRLDETLHWELGARWRARQSLLFSAFVPTASDAFVSTYDVDQQLALERTWARDSGIAELRVDYVDFPTLHGAVTRADGTIDPHGVVVPGRQQLLTELLAKWRRDLSNFWSSELGIGGLFAFRPDDGGGRLIQPVGLAALHYSREAGNVSLTYAHTVQANPLIGELFATDRVSLLGAIPLSTRHRVFAAASAGYEHARVVDSNGALAARIDVWLADATLDWNVRPELALFARYQFTDQIGDPHDAAPLPSFRRNIVLVGLTATYPAEPIAALRARPSFRADRSDAPGISPPHSPSTALPAEPTPAAPAAAP